MKKLLYVALPILASCTTIQPNPNQQAYIQQRQISANQSLEQKATYFENNLPLKENLITTPRTFDNSCQYLTYLAEKRTHSPSPH